MERCAPSSEGEPPAPRSGLLLPLRALAELLAQTMGKEKSEEALIAGARRLGLPTDRLDQAQASALFAELSTQGGLTGIAARFARPRLVLKYSAAR